LATPCSSDSDGDGVPDPADDCPDSDTSATVVIDGCDTGALNSVLPNGCTLADEIGVCAELAETHGDFVSCVAQLTNEWQAEGVISNREKGTITRCAAMSAIGN
jgi:hypothetical protein